MSGGLPPVPDLIPIAALLKGSPGNNNVSGASRECAPCARSSEVMGEQRSRRQGLKAAGEVIDSGGSRGASAAPQPPHQSRKARSERHRKSDRRREHHRKPAIRTRSSSKHSSPRSREPSPERPANPRVNPIFVWIRQEDTRIVDVKCEDYDKRNRILLTKTAQGWRAIPRTETLVPTLKEAADKHHHHHHRNRKSRKTKVRRKSTAVQVDSDIQDLDDDDRSTNSPTWTSPVNVESHLPSHKIHVPKKCPSPDPSVNSAVTPCAQTQEKCGDTSCDVTSPLDNLLAVAEFEFNQHMQSGEWNPKSDDTNTDDDDQKDFLTNMEQLNSLLESACSKSNDDSKDFEHHKTEDCDYTEDDDNNLAMDDILSRLEQSLRSPEIIGDVLETSFETKIKDIKEVEDFTNDINENSYKTVPEDLEFFDENKEKPTPSPPPPEDKEAEVESSTTDEPTDLSIKPKYNEMNPANETEEPTDLTLPRSSSPARSPSPARPPSQSSEAIQSPQPSGIPAVPPSPDIVSTSANCKSKSVFLESLLTTSSQKIALNSEVTIIRQKEPLDLGKCRKSASPTVTCSEDRNSGNSETTPEPPNKKFKPEDISLKTLLDVEKSDSSKPEKVTTPETPRLLELLKTDPASGPDPLTQLRQILYDTSLNVPDPMLVPKERLSQIISNPGREIPKLLKQRPELRLPEALAFPHLLQDPDILVITLQQLETIILKQNHSFNLKDIKSIAEKSQEKTGGGKRPPEKEVRKRGEEIAKISNSVQEPQIKSSFNELASDIDAATTAAFNQMIWLPYLNQLEAMSFGGNPEMMKMLSNSLPISYPGQIPDINHLIGANRLPPPIGFPMQQPPINYNNSLEVSMWQEAMMQANMLRPKVPFENLNANNRNNFRDYLDKVNFATAKNPAAAINHKMHLMNKPNLNLYPDANGRAGYHNSFLNIPNAYQVNNSKQNLQIPHYNPLFPSSQKSYGNQPKPPTLPYLSKHKPEIKSNYGNFYHHRMEEKHHQRAESKQKTFYKSFGGSCQKNSGGGEAKEKPASSDFSKHHTQPIDLSGSTAPTSKLKVKQHLIDPVNAPKLLKHDDNIPEVGSTTASVEEMQDAHKHLWHPLFGNQKGYHSPWNWTTVTATGE